MSDVFGLYDVTINLNSRNLNQVRKKGVTAPEIAILKAIHSLPNEFLGGVEPVTDIVRTGEIARSEAAERLRLGGADGDIMAEDGETTILPIFTKARFQLVYPHEHIPLPREVPGFEEHKINPASLANLRPVGRPKKDNAMAAVLED